MSIDNDPKSIKASALAAHLGEIDRLVADACRRNGLDMSIRADDATFRATAERVPAHEDEADQVDLTDEEREQVNAYANAGGPDALTAARSAALEFRALQRGPFAGVLGAMPRTLSRYLAAHPRVQAALGQMDCR